MKVLSPLLGFLLLLVPGLHAQTGPTATNPAVFMVIWLNAKDESFYRMGTAFHVGDGIFYTNAHVVRPLRPLPPEFDQAHLWSAAGDLVGPAEVSCVDSRWRKEEGSATFFDVAQLRLPGSANLPALRFSDRAPVSGMNVRIVGFPAASRANPPKQYTASGRIEDTNDKDFRIRIHDGFALKGSSGSPVLNDADKVVGIIYAGNKVDRAVNDVQWAVMLGAVTSACR